MSELWRWGPCNNRMSNTNGALRHSSLCRCGLARTQHFVLPSIALSVHHLPDEGPPGSAASAARANSQGVQGGLLALLPFGALHLLTISVWHRRPTPCAPLEVKSYDEPHAKRTGWVVAIPRHRVQVPTAVCRSSCSPSPNCWPKSDVHHLQLQEVGG